MIQNEEICVSDKLFDVYGHYSSIGAWLKSLSDSNLAEWGLKVDSYLINEKRELETILQIMTQAVLFYAIEMDQKTLPRDPEWLDVLAQRFAEYVVLEEGRRKGLWTFSDDLYIYKYDEDVVKINPKGVEFLTATAL